MRDLYISQLLPWDELRRLCAETGAGVELIEFGVADNLDHFDETMRRIRRELDAFDAPPALTVHGPFLDLNPATWDSLVQESTARRFGQACDAALAIGATKIVFHTGFYPRANFIQGWAEREAEFFIRFLEGRAGVQVALENVFDPFPEPLLEVWERVNDPQFQLCLDIGHAHCHSRVPVVEWAEKLLPALGHVHLHDNDGFDPLADNPDSHRALGAGTIPLDELFAVLRQRPDISYAIECAAKEDVRKSIDALRARL